MGTAIKHFLNSNVAVEHTFLAAGMTIALVATVQSLGHRHDLAGLSR